jgi:hypothetical protein
MSSALAVTAMLSALAVRGWQRGAAIDTSIDRTASTLVVLPAAADPGRYGDLRDVRLIDDRGIETPYALAPRAHESAFARDTDAARLLRQRYIADLGDPPAAASSVRLRTATPAFARVLTVECSNDRVTWRTVERRTLTRDARGDAHLEISLGGERARWWRATIGDAADVPLADVHVALVTQRHALRFTAEAQRRYALAFDGPHVPVPLYDLPTPPTSTQTAAIETPIALHADSPRREAAPSSPPQPTIPAWTSTAAFVTLVVALGTYSARLLRQR